MVVLSLTLSLGAHWVFLQSVAWVGMVVSFSESAPLSEALAKTFSGKHPCKLCKVVNEGKASEQKQDVTKSLGKLDFVCAGSNPVLDPPPPFPRILGIINSFRGRVDAPPAPPPKAV